MGRYSPKYSDEPTGSAVPQQTSPSQISWPQVFPKPIVGIGRDGVINEFDGVPINTIHRFQIIPGALEAIRKIRLKGYRLVILTNQGWIKSHPGMLSHDQVNNIHQHLMTLLGQAGCFNIDGLYYSESFLKEDIYCKPGTGMFDRAAREIKVNWKQGWFVGDDLADLKAAEKVGAKPILVKTGLGSKTLDQLGTFANKGLLKKTQIYDSLLSFADSLE